MSDSTSASTFLHLVYFYPREGGTPDEATHTIEGCKKYLAGIPTVLKLQIGTPAGTPRAVVDNAYSVALMVEFADVAGYKVYEDHPDHLTFIAENSKFWSRVQVFDSLTIPF